MRPLVMGVLNVTPDSFSDGGRWLDPEAAVAHGLALVAEGAGVVDVGGESTRPGAEPVPEAEERARVVDVVAGLAAELAADAPHARISIDTRKAGVARSAVEAGASLVNDVSASLWPVAAECGVGWVAMHMQGEPRTMQVRPHYDDVVAEVRAFLVERAEAARAAGVEEIWIDPGIGFGKTIDDNLRLLRDLRVLVDTGLPVMVGSSRKSFLGRLAGDAPADDRLEGSVATAAWALAHGAAMVRVHDVGPTVEAARLLEMESLT
jgi:dihydropteroate synthase